MPDPDKPGDPGRDDKALWVLMGLMALVVVGGLAYGLSYPALYSNGPAQTTGSGVGHVPSHLRPNHPL